MRIRFLKSQTYDGNRTIIVNDIPIFEACRFFIEFGQAVNVENYILTENNVTIILEGGCIIHAAFDEVELSEPSVYTPSSSCCRGK